MDGSQDWVAASLMFRTTRDQALSVNLRKMMTTIIAWVCNLFHYRIHYNDIGILCLL